MADEVLAAVEIAQPNAFNTGSNLYRAYLLDVDSDPDDPQVKGVFKRGNEYPDTQQRIRAILKGEGPEGDDVYEDADCTVVFKTTEPGESGPWNLTLVRKQRSTIKREGVDRAWLKMVLENPDSSAEDKIAAMKKFI